MFSRLLVLVSALVISQPVLAQEQQVLLAPETNMMDELNPNDPNIEQILENYDRAYEEETGMSPFVMDLFAKTPSCYRQSCAVWVQVVKSTQLMYLYVNGVVTYTWPVSTGEKGFTTPNFDTHPNGRIYDKYTSKTYPEGDYNGLGNMPYAVFFYKGYAIHGTSQGNWRKLGRPASHGCIRLHPDNAYILNRMVREKGIRAVWITVQD